MVEAESDARLRLLYELSCAFAARLDLDELVPLVISKCRDALRSESVAILLLDRQTDELYFPFVAEDDPEVVEKLSRVRLPADRGIAGAVVRSGRPLRVDDAAKDPRFYREVVRDTGVATHALLSAPLCVDDEVIGVIQAANRQDGRLFRDEDLDLLVGISASVAVAINNACRYGEVRASEQRLRAQVGALRRDLARRDQFGDIIGGDPGMREVFRLMESAAASPINVLIEGGTGTGKELVARAIHRASARADAPFVAVNCAAVTETLLESELFGHRKGAFTGAHQDHRGLFEAASGGTIFLDEIGEMPLSMQAKLLRVLQEGEIVPVGDNRPRRIDVRVISATNRDLGAEVERRSFRQDLFYRVAAFPIRLPALCERRGDIPLLVDRLLAASAERHRKRIAGIDAGALARLAAFDWPGNVRELQNEIDRAVALAGDGETIRVAHLSTKLAAPASSPAGEAFVPGPARAAGSDSEEGRPAGTGDLRLAREEFEKRFIAGALRQNDGNVSRTARVLGLSRVMLQRKMKEFGLRDRD